MRIYLFGSTGMLGNYVKYILEKKKYNLKCINRKEFDILKDSLEKLNHIIKSLKEDD